MATKKIKGKNVPNLRFPGFDGEWEEVTVDQMAEKVNSGKTPLGGEAAYSNTGITFIRSQNVNYDQLDLSDVTFISTEINNTMKNSIVRANDILLNITGASLGRSCVVPNDFETGNVNQHVCIIRLKSGYNPRFVQPFLSSTKGQNIILSYQTGSGREGLNFENIKRIKISCPKAAEQDRIASFLSMLDERIQTQSKIIKELESLITATTQQLLSQRIRFRDKSAKELPDWQSKKIKDVLAIGNGKDYRHLSSGENPVYGTGGLMTFVDSFLHDGETVCIGRKGTIDTPMFIKGKIWTVDTLFYTHSFVNVIPKFIYYVFKSIRWKEYNEASGVPSLSKSTVENISIEIPSQEEQTRIANFLTLFEDKLEVEKAILQRYKIQKNHLLSRLFI